LKRFGDAYRHYLQGRLLFSPNCFMLAYRFEYFSFLKMDAHHKRQLTFNTLHGAVSQKTELIITAAVRTNLT
jgi:hypothetical protein